MQLNFLSKSFLHKSQEKDIVRANMLNKQRTRNNSLMQSNPYHCNNFSYNCHWGCGKHDILWKCSSLLTTNQLTQPMRPQVPKAENSELATMTSESLNLTWLPDSVILTTFFKLSITNQFQLFVSLLVTFAVSLSIRNSAISISVPLPMLS